MAGVRKGTGLGVGSRAGGQWGLGVGGRGGGGL